jgi:threonine dehydrogenase-like Zn-dependent dehydrogenase
MLQQVMTNPGEIIFREVPVPEVKENQVLVKIMNIGICGSDIHVYHGKHPFTKYPVTQGHEVSGEITELGKNVTEFHVGQKVTIEPQVYCGATYHIVFNPTKVEGKCDACGADTVLRDDDKPETVQKRLAVYHEQTQPLIEYYDKQGILKSVDGTKPMDEVFSAIVGILGE